MLFIFTQIKIFYKEVYHKLDINYVICDVYHLPINRVFHKINSCTVRGSVEYLGQVIIGENVAEIELYFLF